MMNTETRPARWHSDAVINGVITWQCIDRPDAVTIEGGAYVAWRGVDLPDGGQTWEKSGTWSTAELAMRHLEQLAQPWPTMTRAEVEKRWGELTPEGFISPTTIRTARKEHRCRQCGRDIQPGERYAEYHGETPGYQSGDRYHLGACADRQLRPKAHIVG